MQPYYSHAGITIYHGDCRDILPHVTADVVVTDPPYPGLDYEWAYVPIETLTLPRTGWYFWMQPPVLFPLPFTAMHVWSKSNVYLGDKETWEAIYEVGGKRVGSVIRDGAINCDISAQMLGDIFYKHPTQKPARLMRKLIARTVGMILDPFMGSGTTLVAAKQLGRKAIGIEIEERYCEIAVKRLAQEVLPLVPVEPEPTQQEFIHD